MGNRGRWSPSVSVCEISNFRIPLKNEFYHSTMFRDQQIRQVLFSPIIGLSCHPPLPNCFTFIRGLQRAGPPTQKWSQWISRHLVPGVSHFSHSQVKPTASSGSGQLGGRSCSPLPSGEPLRPTGSETSPHPTPIQYAFFQHCDDPPLRHRAPTDGRWHALRQFHTTTVDDLSNSCCLGWSRARRTHTPCESHLHCSSFVATGAGRLR